MAYNTKPIITDKDGNPISQYYNPATDQYEPVEGSNGGNKVTLENNDLSLIPILDKLSQLTGTVIDENVRKSNEITRQGNEVDRIALYNDLLTELTRIGQITEQVPQSVLDSVSNLSNKIGELQDLDTIEKTNLVLALNEVYQNLTSHKAENATQANLGHIKLAPNFVNATLQNGWVGTIKYTKDTLGYVTLEFNAYGGVVEANTIIATLPVGFRPNATLKLFVDAENTSVNQSTWYVIIRLDGTIKVGLRSGIQAGYSAMGQIIFKAMA